MRWTKKRIHLQQNFPMLVQRHQLIIACQLWDKYICDIIEPNNENMHSEGVDSNMQQYYDTNGQCPILG